MDVTFTCIFLLVIWAIIVTQLVISGQKTLEDDSGQVEVCKVKMLLCHLFITINLLKREITSLIGKQSK